MHRHTTISMSWPSKCHGRESNVSFNSLIIIHPQHLEMVSWWNIVLTHWGRVTHICVGKLTITVSDNGLSPGRRQAIIWTNAGISLIGPLGTNLSEISIEIYIFSSMKMHLELSSGIWRPFCLGPNVLIYKTPLLQWCHMGVISS